MDRISLLDIMVYGRHGVSDEEQAIGRPFAIDVEVSLDLRQAGATDDIGATVNYAALCEVVLQANEAGPFRLLEAFAERIAKEVIASFPVAEVTVRVRKPHPPVGMLVGSAQVEITREARECCK
jgi:7,8-dihydroneopterin aldolase/epimerase/oxygenase